MVSAAALPLAAGCPLSTSSARSAASSLMPSSPTSFARTAPAGTPIFSMRLKRASAGSSADGPAGAGAAAAVVPAAPAPSPTPR